MPKFQDITGSTFGRLKVISQAGRANDGKILWLCECSCENKNTKLVRVSDLKSGKTQSCGCLHKENHTKHGLSRSRINGIYQDMVQRCTNPNLSAFYHYGGRGITVYDEWLGENGFVNFVKWANDNGYSDDLTIDRINANGNYEPENCRWVTMKIQQNNRRNNLYVTINRVTKTASQWEQENQLGRGTLSRRVRQGICGEELLKPVNKSYQRFKKEAQ